MVHFPTGQSPLPLQPANLGADLVRAVGHVPNASQPSATPGDTISVQSLHAALELDLLNYANPNTAPAGAADYQLARTAALASEPVTSMEHLGQAVQQSPAYASVALQDPAFQGMRVEVQDLANRMNPVGGVDQTAGAGTYQPPRGVLPAGVVTGDSPVVSEQPVVTNLPQIANVGQGPAPKSANVPLAQNASAPPVTSQTLPDKPDAASQSQPLSAPPEPGRLPAPAPQSVPSGSTLAPAVSTTLDLKLLQSWDTEAVRAVATAEYQLARTAIQAGDRPAALLHLEQAILAYPGQAAAALADRAFDSIKGQVRDLVAHLALDARIRAEAAISEAHAAIQALGTAGAARPLALARAYLEAAQASFQMGTYTGYVQAACAAQLSERIARGKRSRASLLWSAGAFAPVKRVVERAARRLWQRLPLLAILLGWFFAGIVAAVASLPFAAGAAFRAWLLPVWAMGLLAFVLFGLVRSIRAVSKRLR